ncbi:hypothetical protein [Paraburkholderia sp. J10-1]|uniref:hypothetical protein n=1 Tax=Paraburkholderia sp. J10-1 TaxID=2805430 RepID=UPI002AB7AD2A|nr:hypothetical protein [Paraburkholderia sp. J10-1]
MPVEIIGMRTINGHKIEDCPQCGSGMLPNVAGMYRSANMTSDETARCFNCGYVERPQRDKRDTSPQGAKQ